MYPNQQQFQNPQVQMYPQQMTAIPQQQPVAQPAQMQVGKYKTKLCRHYQNGNCQLGASCYFAHGEFEMRQMTDPVPNQLPTQGPAKIGASNYKTVQCKYFQQGFCKNSATCSFAHGISDVGAQGALQVPQQQQQDPNVLILIMILKNLEQVFPQNYEILEKLKVAQQNAQSGQSQEATKTILQIMESSDRTQTEKQQYQTIYQNAQVYYQTVMAQQKPQQ